MPTVPEQTALTALELARAGRFAEVRELFVPQLRSMVVPEALQTAWTAELDRQGAVTSVGAALGEPAGAGAVVVKVPVTEYEPAQHVDPAVIDDIAAWLDGII